MIVAVRGWGRPAGGRRWTGVVALVGVLMVGATANGSDSGDRSPAEVVALRFPPEWNADVTASLGDAHARADDALMFSPNPIYALAQSPLAGGAQPVLAFADPADGAERMALAVTAPPPSAAVAATPAPPRRPSGLFNDAQIASIKGRLHLSAEQEPYWPAVESALRAIGLRQHHPARRRAAPTVDPDSAEVQQLKSAAVPLIMLLREEQKREVRELAHVMGLGSVAAQF